MLLKNFKRFLRWNVEPSSWKLQPLCPDLQARGPCRARPVQTHIVSVLRIPGLRAPGSRRTSRISSMSVPAVFVREHMLARLRQDMHTFCAFADIRKAFDTSWVEATLIRLHEVGATGGMWRTVASFLCGTLSQVGVFGDVPPPRVDKGIAEGRVLSPLLF